MKFKHMLFVLTITTSIIFACMLGSSYAYYTLSNGTTVTATTGEFDANVSVVFSESEYINLKTGVPINSTDVDKYASASKFTLIPDATKLRGYDVAVKIAISNITIDTALKISAPGTCPLSRTDRRGEVHRSRPLPAPDAPQRHLHRLYGFVGLDRLEDGRIRGCGPCRRQRTFRLRGAGRFPRGCELPGLCFGRGVRGAGRFADALSRRRAAHEGGQCGLLP